MNNTHFQRGSLLFQQGRYREAVGELRLQLGQVPDDYYTHGFLALCLKELEEYDDATDHAQRAIHLAPDEAFAHYALAQVMMSRYRIDEAQAAIKEAIRLNPYDADYFGLFAYLHLAKSRWREGLEVANKGLEVDPENRFCTNMRAQALVKLGDREAAAATMGEALARRPDDAFTHANQGWALLHEGQPHKALEHFRESLRLDPELEWAREGIVEAMKARNVIYRWMLAWFLWMERLSPQVRWGLIIGAYFGQRIIGQMARNSPDLAPFLWPLLYAYFAFVLMTWLSSPLFNLLLRFNRFGRHALSADQIRGANVLAACLLVTVGFLAAWLASGRGFFLDSAIYFALLSLPASAIFVCHPGWPRQAMAVITLALLGVLLSIVVWVVVPWIKLPKGLADGLVNVWQMLPLAMIASQFAAMYLMAVRPQK